MQRQFYIPDSAEVIFVSDLFAHQYVGGAELTMEAIIEASPYEVFRVNSQFLTDEMVQKNKDKHWVLVNFSGTPREALIELVVSKCSFSIIECDYKYCRYRSAHLHKLKENTECDCHKQEHGRFVHGLMKRAKSVHFMSEGQKQEYEFNFPDMKSWDHCRVQTSTWKEEHLDLLKKHRDFRVVGEKWAVLGGGSWIKNQQATELYLRQNNIPYEVIGNLPYEEFIELLSTYKGLCFHPSGFDTCPRLVIEAKLMGLELDLNDNVQHAREEWFQKSPQEIDKFLRKNAKTFWDKVGF